MLPYHFFPDYSDAFLEQLALQRDLGHDLIIRMELLKDSSHALEIERFSVLRAWMALSGR